MKIHKGYKYRLKTNKKILHQFVQFAGACSFVWNKIVAINEGRYLAGVPRLSYQDAAGLLPLRIATLDLRIANRRRDFLHKLSTDISKNHAVIVLEDLQVKNMSQPARGTVEEPGRNVDIVFQC
jgi:hypothetical protein